MKLNAAFKFLRHESRENLASFLGSLYSLNKDEVVARLLDPEITLIEETILRALMSDMQTGETKTLEKMLDRIFGKSVQVISAQVTTKTLEDLIVGDAKPVEESDPIGLEYPNLDDLI